MDKKQIAFENIAIIEKGSYTVNGKEILLGTPEELRKVVLCRPDFTRSCVDAALAAIKETSNGDAVIEVNADDTFLSLRKQTGYKALALNFANAYRPGGGYLVGSRAQEESLCRCSTLYATLSCEEARELYEYNRSHVNPEGSDYMLLSPDVTVFREAPDLELLAEPYKASVISYAAPNAYGEAESLDPSALSALFARKIRNLLAVAWHFGYDALVLGAWGCGAFGNDAKRVADLFCDAIRGEGFGKLFKKIVFSIYSPPPFAPAYNITCFRNRFE